MANAAAQPGAWKSWAKRFVWKPRRCRPGTGAAPTAGRRGILGAADALRAAINSVIDPADQAAYQELLARLQAELPAADYRQAWAAGAAAPLAEVVDFALEPPAPPQTMDTLTQAQAAKAKYGGLSPRERETAALIALGKSNREIAEQMVVRVKTVETYVTRILNKLGFELAGADRHLGARSWPGTRPGRRGRLGLPGADWAGPLNCRVCTKKLSGFPR